MTPIVSGTTTERIVRTAIATLIFSGYSCWLLWDGYVSYPQQNIRSAFTNKIGVEPPDPLPVSDPKLTADVVEAIPKGTTVDLVKNQWGEPHFEHQNKLYYFGEAGFAVIQVGRSKVAELRWNEGPRYKQLDITLQRIFGFSLIPVGLGFLIQLFRVLRTRVELNDQGLHIRGRPLISFDDICSISMPDPDSKSSSVGMHYQHGDEEKTVKLDPYVVKKLPEMIKIIQDKLDLRNV